VRGVSAQAMLCVVFRVASNECLDPHGAGVNEGEQRYGPNYGDTKKAKQKDNAPFETLGKETQRS
jgi:hypothetical protein